MEHALALTPGPVRANVWVPLAGVISNTSRADTGQDFNTTSYLCQLHRCVLSLATPKETFQPVVQPNMSWYILPSFLPLALGPPGFRAPGREEQPTLQ